MMGIFSSIPGLWNQDPHLEYFILPLVILHCSVWEILVWVSYWNWRWSSTQGENSPRFTLLAFYNSDGNQLSCCVMPVWPADLLGKKFLEILPSCCFLLSRNRGEEDGEERSHHWQNTSVSSLPWSICNDTWYGTGHEKREGHTGNATKRHGWKKTL